MNGKDKDGDDDAYSNVYMNRKSQAREKPKKRCPCIPPQSSNSRKSRADGCGGGCGGCGGGPGCGARCAPDRYCNEAPHRRPRYDPDDEYNRYTCSSENVVGARGSAASAFGGWMMSTADWIWDRRFQFVLPAMCYLLGVFSCDYCSSCDCSATV
ncbi:Hypothetical protein CINCED_3A023093 [Cinara cedri]|uniref:Uncharacterized protein n=1 Tax=Cinara cedri TaxID=506608 RepID=A0A5E4MBV7_9HEMI|nr:Hypothetical protein CINCED_3A023093 [Cinara cedri]